MAASGWIVTDSSQGQHQKSKKKSPMKSKKKSFGPRASAVKSASQTRQKKKSKSSNEILYDLQALNDFTWESIKYPENMPFNDNTAGGFLELEEIDGFDVEYQDSPAGRVAKFKRIENEDSEGKQVSKSQKHDQDEQNASVYDDVEDQGSEDAPEKEPVIKCNVDAWINLGLHEKLVQALGRLGFSQPTEIQSRVIPEAIGKDRCDIIGAAETGSGKTLAFGLPILHMLHQQDEDSSEEFDGPKALILTPTRELAIQIRDHLQAITQGTPIQIMAVVGGISIQKQMRLLDRRPQVVIATPGRLWEIISEGHSDFFDRMASSLRFLVLDEADRMIENGHFKELDSILQHIQQKKGVDEWEDQENNTNGDDDDPFADDLSTRNVMRQTFVFSATLSSIFRNEKDDDPKKETLDSLMKKIDFKDENPCIVNLTREQLLAHGLTERKIDCVQKDKDLYLYYFFLRYPGRTIVFVNSIDTIRRLVPLFTHLKLPVYGLHAQMQQRQRLKNLDRFKSNKRAILVASDVAARGLDIPNVDHVVHYQIPRTPELYVHRSGRTARANKDGITVLFNSAEENKNYRMLCKLLKKPDGLEDFPVDLLLLNPLKERLRLAAEIETAQHRKRKSGSEQRWLKNMAEAMDIELDEDQVKHDLTDSDDEDQLNARRKHNKEERRIINARVQLDEMLKKPLLPVGVSARYITSNGISGLPERLMQNLQMGSDMSALPAMETTRALDDARKRKRR